MGRFKERPVLQTSFLFSFPVCPVRENVVPSSLLTLSHAPSPLLFWVLPPLSIPGCCFFSPFLSAAPCPLSLLSWVLPPLLPWVLFPPLPLWVLTPPLLPWVLLPHPFPVFFLLPFPQCSLPFPHTSQRALSFYCSAASQKETSCL